MAEKPEDKLGLSFEKIKSWCKENKVHVIHGEVMETRGMPVVLTTIHEDNFSEHFLNQLGKLEIGAAVINVERLSLDEWEEKNDQLMEASESPEREEILSELQEAKAHIGHVSSIKVAAFAERPKIIIRSFTFAPWSHVLSDEIEDGEPYEDQEEWEDPKISERIGALARRVAEDHRFVNAKKQAERQYAVKTVLKSEEIGGALYQIAVQAGAIFDMEIKPKIEAAQKSDAENLLAQGESMKEVARRLGIKLSELKRLVE